MKLYKIEVEIVNAKREVIGVVKGKGLGLLAVTPVVDKHRPNSRRRNITHIPTGMKVFPTLDNQQEALAVLPRLVDCADWNFFGNHPSTEPGIEAAWKAVKAAGLR